jgi:hypothetical protein
MGREAKVGKAVPEAVRYGFGEGSGQGAVMDWARMLAIVTGTVDQELLAQNEYLVAENRIMKAQLKGRLSSRTPSERRSARSVIAWAPRFSAMSRP